MTPMRTTMALLVALAAGCVTVHASTSPGANLDHYRTFAWYQSPTPKSAQLAFERSTAGALVRARIARDLAQKGIRETRDDPDFWVAYHRQQTDRVDIRDWGYPGLFWGAPGAVRVDEYSEGALVVDFIDPHTGRIFWRGRASSVLDHAASPDMHKLVAAVDDLMRRYPVETASAGARPTL